MKETIYSSRASLHAPRAFLRQVREDARVVYHISWQLFVRNLRGQVRQSLLGYAWMLLPPLAVALVWIFVGRAWVLNFESVARVRRGAELSAAAAVGIEGHPSQGTGAARGLRGRGHGGLQLFGAAAGAAGAML